MNRSRRFKAKRRRQLIARTMSLLHVSFYEAKRYLAEQARLKHIAETPITPLMVGRIGRGSRDAVQNKDGSITLTLRTVDPNRAMRKLELKTKRKNAATI